MSIAPLPTHSRVLSSRRVFALPSTRAGRWAAGLAGGVLVLLVILGGAGAGVDTADWGWGARLALGLSGLIGVGVAISAGVTAVIAVIKGEGSIIILGPLLFGAFWVVFVLGEFLSPH